METPCHYRLGGAVFISRAGLPLLQQVRDLDFSQQLQRKVININDLVREELGAGTYQDKYGRPVTVQTRLSKGAVVFADADKLRTVLNNLRLDASIHPNAPGGINLLVTTGLTRDGQVRIRLTSRGAEPIPEDIRRRIFFEAFTTRADGRAGVNGVGKISARQTIEAHGGSVRALNRGPNREPCLEFLLPAALYGKKTLRDLSSNQELFELLQR
ncbi:hypothetical protein AUJ14_04730 [Candidatus Micrarchaeota archaeon CG1_02_55_22]|nr:MAG: hypothetical protein AUJ14_04730 [Candidatus Micrarchaeota archaeon CG1_02_55_22]